MLNYLFIFVNRCCFGQNFLSLFNFRRERTCPFYLLHTGKDGQVRVVDVLTMFGTYRRGVNKLAVLDLNEGEVNYSPFQKKGQ